MPQLNVHVPASSDLLARVAAAAQRLGTSPSALARVVLEVALDPYVQAQLGRQQQAQAHSARVVASLRSRFSGALPARPFVSGSSAGEADTADEAGERDEPAPGVAGRGERAAQTHIVETRLQLDVEATVPPSAGDRDEAAAGYSAPAHGAPRHQAAGSR